MSQRAQTYLRNTTSGFKRPVTALAVIFSASLALPCGTAVAATVQTPACPKLADLQGAWEDKEAKTSILFEPTRLMIDEKFFHVAAILKEESCHLTVRNNGLRATWELAEMDYGISLRRGTETLHLTKLASVPDRLVLKPMTLGATHPVSKETSGQVAAELLARAKVDQEKLKGPDEERNKVLYDNRDYLKKLLVEYGWIDIDRFGKYASSAALLIVQHGGDLPLLMAVLPVAEEDARKHNALGEMISVVYDRTNIKLGKRQRYGTQIIDDPQGRPMVLPVEDRAKVDVYRKELGIPLWAEYLEMASKYLENGKPIRIPGDDE